MYFYVERCNETLQDNICQVYIREHGPITIEEVAFKQKSGPLRIFRFVASMMSTLGRKSQSRDFQRLDPHMEMTSGTVGHCELDAAMLRIPDEGEILPTMSEKLDLPSGAAWVSSITEAAVLEFSGRQLAHVLHYHSVQ